MNILISTVLFVVVDDEQKGILNALILNDFIFDLTSQIISKLFKSLNELGPIESKKFEFDKTTYYVNTTNRFRAIYPVTSSF